jgi:hypothetical protein
MSGNYPKAVLPIDMKRGHVLKRCFHCGKDLGLKKWDNWNGFLVECPHCHGLHGKRWGIRRTVLASFLFNALSFPFLMRPRSAMPMVIAFLGAAILGNLFLDRLSNLWQVGAVAIFMLSPMVLNGFVLVVHERDLDNSAPPRRALTEPA